MREGGTVEGANGDREGGRRGRRGISPASQRRWPISFCQFLVEPSHWVSCRATLSETPRAEWLPTSVHRIERILAQSWNTPLFTPLHSLMLHVSLSPSLTPPSLPPTYISHSLSPPSFLPSLSPSLPPSLPPLFPPSVSSSSFPSISTNPTHLCGGSSEM